MMARRAEVVGLDIAEPQIIVAYPDDQFFTWHGRVLLRRLGQSSWIWSTPDREVQVADLSQLRVLPVARRGPLPEEADGDCYFLDDLSVEELRALHATADRLGQVLGAPAAQAEAPGAAASSWRISDVCHAMYGTVVADDTVGNGATGFYRGSRGMAQIVNDEDQAEWLHVERVKDRDLITWKEAKAAGPGRDHRIAGSTRDSGGRRFLPLADALNQSRPLDLDTIKDWPHAGPRASVEVLRGVRGLGRELITYHDPWLAAAGLQPDSPHRYEHRLLCSALGLMVNYDQLDLANCASAELLSRRLVQLERAVRACPRSPNFTGLGKMIEMNLSDGGGLRTDEFTRHFAAVAEADARVMKQTRLLREELKQTGTEKTDDDESPAAGGRRRRGKNV